MTRQTDPIAYKVGGTYEFTVHTLHDNLCDLIDDAGLHVYLKHTAGLHITKGQKLRCCITAMGQNRPKVELDKAEYLAVSNSRVNVKTVNERLDEVRGNWDGAGFATLLLMDEVEDLTYGATCRHWITLCMNSGRDLKDIYRAVVAFMEDTDFLSLCTPTERDTYQQRLIETVEALSASARTQALLADGTAAQFVERLLDRLEKSGYVYHPESNFRVLACLFVADPTLATDYAGRLFEVVRRWPLDIWQKTPFAEALPNILKIYIDENIELVGRSNDNIRLVRNLVQALSILLLLADEATDRHTALARLCVIASYVDKFNNNGLLNAAAGSLLGNGLANFSYSLADTSADHMTYLLKCTQDATTEKWPVGTASCYLNGARRLRIDADGITIESDCARARNVVDHINLWGNLQVTADRRSMPSLSGDITVADSKRLWEAIEHELFVPDQTSAHANGIHSKDAKTETAKSLHSVKDKVVIWVKRVVSNAGDDNIAYCCFEGEQKESGYIYLHDIIGYVRNASVRTFQDDYGKPLLLEAVIAGEEYGGYYRFSMRETLKNYVTSDVKPGDTVICSLGLDRKAGTKGYTPGIALTGGSVSLVGDFPEDLQRGELVSATYISVADGSFHMQCSINGRAEGEKADPLHLFHKLLCEYAFVDAAPADDEPQANTDEPQANTDDLGADVNLLDAAYVRELVRILDRMAAICDDYVKSYNYIAYARVLCRMLPDGEARADYYRGRKQLIEMLYDFAKNDKVDTTKLDQLQNGDGTLFGNDNPMREKLQQLRIISYLGYQSHDEELQHLRSTTQGLTRDMASLAMAYNILRENNMTPQANDVLNRIKNTLKLNGYESNLKTYGGGIESQTVEFKTSIIYPPENGSFPDPERQKHTILKVIAAFLNTDGGTLYIGVNDSGAGVGVYNDLCYQDFNGDRDKYQRAVLDSVALQWDNSVASYVTAQWDSDVENGKDVLIVSVSPYAAGVQLGNEWVYRNGSGNRHLTKDEFADYNVRRQARLNSATPAPVSAAGGSEWAPRPDDSGNGAPANESTDGVQTVSSEQRPEDTDHTTNKTDGNGKPKDEGKPKDDDKPKDDGKPRVATSRRRDNVLLDYEPKFVPFEGCFKFTDDGKFSKITDYDYDTTTELTLPYYDEDLRDSYLVLGYDDCTIGKVPMRELTQFADYNSYQRYNGARLLFAAIATNDDGLVSVARENRNGGRVMVRVDTISNIEEGRLASRGDRLVNEGIAECALGYEIMSAADLDKARSVLDRDARSLGLPVATLTGDLKDALPLPDM